MSALGTNTSKQRGIADLSNDVQCVSIRSY